VVTLVMAKIQFYPLLIIIFLSVSCHTTYQAGSVQYSNYRIQYAAANNSLSSVIKPYGDSVNKLMNAVIGFNQDLLERKRAVNTLGYFITDAYLEMARQKVNSKVDAAFMNSGGIRLPDLPAGAITQGKIFELMPFDNLLVQVKMKGSELKQYLDTLAVGEGIIQSGMTMQVMNKTPREVMIGNKPLDAGAEYTVVHSDYVVINSNLLKNLSRTTSGYLLRDAIIDYVKLFNSRGNKITVADINRVSYVN
jgi:2',3'-cyclic-nucleotide 2'-phosphodiesterase (5'-nucleotidase family)